MAFPVTVRTVDQVQIGPLETVLVFRVGGEVEGIGAPGHTAPFIRAAYIGNLIELLGRLSQETDERKRRKEGG